MHDHPSACITSADLRPEPSSSSGFSPTHLSARGSRFALISVHSNSHNQSEPLPIARASFLVAAKAMHIASASSAKTRQANKRVLPTCSPLGVVGGSWVDRVSLIIQQYLVVRPQVADPCRSAYKSHSSSPSRKPRSPKGMATIEEVGCKSRRRGFRQSS